MSAERAEGRPSCTIVICTRNRPAELARCLDAISRLTYPDFDVLIVDNAPDGDATKQLAARAGAGYLLEPRVGLSRARNTGARAGGGDIVAYLDDDAVPEPGWLTALAREFADPTVMAATGRVLPIDESLGASAESTYIGGAEPRRFDRQHPLWFELAHFGAIGIGCNMAFARKAFSFWRGFDERLGRGAGIPGAEEHAAFGAIMEEGYAISYAPRARVRHGSAPDPGTVQATELREYHTVGAYATLLLFESRHKWRVMRHFLRSQLGGDVGWRAPATHTVPRLRLLRAALSGSLVYLRSR